VIHPYSSRLPGLVAFGSILVLAGQSGGFFADSWGWVALPLLLVVALALVVADAPSLSRPQLVAIVLLTCVVGWTALSAAWAPTAWPPFLEAERAAIYVAALAAVFLVGRGSQAAIPVGVLAACVAVTAWALRPRLFPQHATDGRLLGPIGYPNGLGLVAAVGLLLGLGLALHADRAWQRAAAAAATVVQMPALVLTFSRGSWVALVAGLTVLTLFELRRGTIVQLVASVPAPALAGWVAGRLPGLTHAGTTLAKTSHDGHLLAIAMLVLAAAAPLPAAAARRARLPRLGRRSRLVLLFALAIVVVAGGTAALTRAGGPDALVQRATATAPGGNLNGRLLSASTNGRGDYWRVAVDEVRAHPALGGGAGTWGRWWLLRRPDSFGALDAHNLYLETLAELGPVGLVLLLAALAAPLLALRGTTAPIAGACAAGYVAFLTHATLDWDWELPAVALAGLLCGAGLLAVAPPSRSRVSIHGPLRAGALALSVLAAAGVFVLQVGNTALAHASDALDADQLDRAAAQARRAQTWQPWSTRPRLYLGQSQLAAGNLAEAATTFDAALRRDAGDWELWYQLALATSGDRRKTALDRATALNPHGPAADNH
jgi:hypothetical protein